MGLKVIYVGPRGSGALVSGTVFLFISVVVLLIGAHVSRSTAVFVARMRPEVE